MPGPFNPILHPHGFHGYWADQGGRKRPGQSVASRGRAARGALRPQIDLGPTAQGRPRARAGSGQAYQRGPAAGLKPTTVQGELKPGGMVRYVTGQGAAAHVEVAKVVSVQVNGATSAITLRTANGVRTVHVNHRVEMHPRSARALRPRPSAFVNHQPIKQWWAGNRSRNAGPLPYNPAQPPSGMGTLGQPGRLKKETMTTGEDLGHPGQAPVTIEQAGRVKRSKKRKKMALRTGGAVLYKDMDTVYMPTTGEALSPRTTQPQGRKVKKPPQNNPVGSPVCPNCGGQDGYHQPGCIRNILNPGGGPTGLGA